MIHPVRRSVNVVSGTMAFVAFFAHLVLGCAPGPCPPRLVPLPEGSPFSIALVYNEDLGRVSAVQKWVMRHTEAWLAINEVAIDFAHKCLYVHRKFPPGDAQPLYPILPGIFPATVDCINFESGRLVRRIRIPLRSDLGGSSTMSTLTSYIDAPDGVMYLEGPFGLVAVDLTRDSPRVVTSSRDVRLAAHAAVDNQRIMLRGGPDLFIDTRVMYVDRHSRHITEEPPLPGVGRELRCLGALSDYVVGWSLGGPGEDGRLYVLQRQAGALVLRNELTIASGWALTSDLIDAARGRWIVAESFRGRETPGNVHVRVYAVPSLEVSAELPSSLYPYTCRSACLTNGGAWVLTVPHEARDSLVIYDVTHGRELGRLQLAQYAGDDIGPWIPFADASGLCFGVFGSTRVLLFEVRERLDTPAQPSKPELPATHG